jgi:chromosome partitioning protein
MSGRVITIAQQKGGAGKTTLAVQLGTVWRQQGRSVAMLDIDPQASLFAWFGERRRRGDDAEGGLVVQGLSGWRLTSEVRRFRDDFDVVLIDSPPHAESEARTAVREADLVLVPCQPNALDLWATAPTLELADRERTQALIVLNRVPPRGRAADAVREEIHRRGWPAATAALGNRQAFAASIAEGAGVVEAAGRSAAASEATALADEVLKRLR